MLGLEGETPQEFLARLSATLKNPAGYLEASVTVLWAHVTEEQVRAVMTNVIGEGPSNAKHLLESLMGRASLFSVASHLFGQHSHTTKTADIFQILNLAIVRRTVVGLPETTNAILRGMAQTYTEGHIDRVQWATFFSRLIWNDGACEFFPAPQHAAHKHVPVAREVLKKVMEQTAPNQNTLLEEAARLVSSHASPQTADLLNVGARWFRPDDLPQSRVFTPHRTPRSLLLGRDAAQQNIYFDGNESLITIAAAGTGKSQAQVIPNLMTYPGSAFVLDVKDELWNATAGYRQKHVGPVYRYAPTDPTNNSHTFNPFDQISRDPNKAALDCQMLAHQLLTVDAHAREKFWDERARDFIWCFAMLIATGYAPSRNLIALGQYLSLPLQFDDLSKPLYLQSETCKVIKQLRELATKSGIPDLASAANTLETSLTTDSNRMDSVLDTARRSVSTFGRSIHVRRAISASSWSPLQLRHRTGTTIYLCLKPGELQAYAPLIRVVFQQHAQALTKDFTYQASTPPITFFLDELPQLGHLSTLLDILDVGRGAGLRLWLFAQNLGQIRDIYGKRADGLINACLIRCFMQPDNEGAKFIAPALGTQKHLFSGKDKPLAEPFDLMGRAFHDDIITLGRGEHPARLSKVLAYKEFKVMQMPPPVVGKPSLAGSSAGPGRAGP